MGTDFNAIIMDVGGGTTDVAVVRNGGLEGTKIFAIGGRAFTKRIARELNIAHQEAEERKLSYSMGKAKKEDQESIKKILKDSVRVWLSGVSLVLKEFGDSEPLPPRILLCGGGSLLPEIEEALMQDKWTHDLAFAKHPAIAFIKPHDVQHVFDKTNTLHDPSDITSLALAHLGIELVEGKNGLVDILRNVGK